MYYNYSYWRVLSTLYVRMAQKQMAVPASISIASDKLKPANIYR